MAKRKKWQDLTITDDYMFKLIMSYPIICKHLIEIILNIKIREIKYLDKEKTFKNNYEGKGIRLDVYVEDEDNSRFILEMQVRDFGEEELGKRIRFYQSSIDYDFLLMGQKYKELGNSAVIFFCPFEIFDGKRRLYTFTNICKENHSIKMDDGMVKVILSSAGEATDDIHPDVAAFLDYMNGKIIQNGFVSEIDNTIRHVKLDGAKEADYMTFQMMIEEERDEARDEGLREGISKSLTMLKSLNISKDVALKKIIETYSLTSKTTLVN